MFTLVLAVRVVLMLAVLLIADGVLRWRARRKLDELSERADRRLAEALTVVCKPPVPQPPSERRSPPVLVLVNKNKA